MVVVTAETGIGKTSVLKEIEYSLLMNPELKEKEYGVGFIHLEEPNYDTALGLLSIHNNKPYHFLILSGLSTNFVRLRCCYQHFSRGYLGPLRVKCSGRGTRQNSPYARSRLQVYRTGPPVYCG
jgi:hypothetical protein